MKPYERIVVCVSRRRSLNQTIQRVTYSQWTKAAFIGFVLLVTVSTVTFKSNLHEVTFNWLMSDRFGIPNESNVTPSSIEILMWVPFFGNQFGQEVFRICPELNCHITHNRSALATSSAVVFHDRDVSVSDLPGERLPGQHFVFFLLESPYHVSGEAFNQLSTNFYTLTMGYRRNADVHLPFGYFEARSKPLPSTFWHELRKLVAKRKKLVAWFVSNCNTPSAREFYVRQLQRYIPVDVYGHCGPLKCPRSNRNCYESVLKMNYKFYIAFENSVCTDFVTEKYFDRLTNFVVPIVFGRKIYEAVGPNNSFIAADDFDGPKKLADYLKQLDKDDNEYLKYFEWMNNTEDFDQTLRYTNGFCKLCRKLRQQGKNPIVTPSETAKHLTRWYKEPGICHDRYGLKVHKL
uniref:Fucosyltransferase n=1 Tax=Trichuris muris TaxID=70415 RepID=A0A5S6QVX2_TRIMR